MVHSMNEEKDILRYIVTQELKDDQHIEIFTTEDRRNDSFEVIFNTAMLVTRVRRLLSYTWIYRKP